MRLWEFTQRAFRTKQFVHCDQFHNCCCIYKSKASWGFVIFKTYKAYSTGYVLKELSLELLCFFCLFLIFVKIKQTPVSQYLKKGLVFLGLFSLHKNPSGDVGTNNSNFHLEFFILRPSEAYESTTFWFAKPPTKISLQLK